MYLNNTVERRQLRSRRRRLRILSRLQPDRTLAVANVPRSTFRLLLSELRSYFQF